MRVRATIQDEASKIQEYNRKMASNDDVLSKRFRQQKHSEEEEEESPSRMHVSPHGINH